MKLKINNVRISLRQEQTLEQAVCRKCGIPRDALGSVQIVRKAVDARKKNDICLNYHVLAEVETGGRQAKRLLADRDITQYQEQQQPTLELGTLPLRAPPVVIGAGPAGLVVANQLNLKGYSVTLFDKNEAPGGLLRFGIPNFKLDKNVIERRMNIITAEGIKFEMGVEIDVNHLPEGFDAYCICTGTPAARDLSIPGRDLKGIYFALEMLAQQNRILEGQTFSKDKLVNAKGKKVLVIGGGDTGSDCIGTSVRQGATSVTQIEIMPQPPVGHNPSTPWPQWPVVLKTTSSHEEGCIRRWCLTSNHFLGKNGNVTGVEVEEVEWIPATDGGRPTLKPTGKKEVIEADMVLLAMGFLKPEQPNFADNVFLAGDAATGASLVVRAMAGGRKTAAEIDTYLTTKN